VGFPPGSPCPLLVACSDHPHTHAAQPCSREGQLLPASHPACPRARRSNAHTQRTRAIMQLQQQLLSTPQLQPSGRLLASCRQQQRGGRPVVVRRSMPLLSMPIPGACLMLGPFDAGGACAASGMPNLSPALPCRCRRDPGVPRQPYQAAGAVSCATRRSHQPASDTGWRCVHTHLQLAHPLTPLHHTHMGRAQAEPVCGAQQLWRRVW
jgi:hypothetical protein